MRALAACITSLLADNAGVKPTLVLLGDIVEFALAKDEVASMAFQRLMELTMVPGHELFDAVWLVPGNHDHHLWEGAREAQYADYIGWRDPALPLEHPWHSTRMLHEHDEHKVGSPLLSAVLRRARIGAAPSSVPAIYPNLALRRGRRCIVFHHGHYIEWPYRLFTMANEYAFEVRPPDHVGELEADNFAWIDFFWSGVGRCGSAGQSIQYAYEHLQTPAEKDELLDRIARGFARSTRNRTWLPAGVEDFAQELTFRAMLGFVVQTADSWGRKAYFRGKDAAAAHASGVREYLQTYVLEQITRECGEDLPEDVTFVFGHTHRPREDASIAIEGLARPVRTFNTGGWVHETPERHGDLGAALVVIDDDLDAVSLHLYRELADLSRYRVEAHEAAAEGTPHSGLFDHITSRLATEPEPWSHLVREVDEAIG
jgi:hypothetical protein